MVDYLRIECEFISRTLELLKQYKKLAMPDLAPKEQYEVTLLINCLLGLLVFPQQLASKDERKSDFSDWLTEEKVESVYEKWHISLDDICCAGYRNKNKSDKELPLPVNGREAQTGCSGLEKKNDKEIPVTDKKELTLRNLVRQMRNAVAHANFSVEASKSSVGQIDYIEFHDKHRENGFHMKLKVTDLENFVHQLADSAMARLRECS
jgi:hypothetical protein